MATLVREQSKRGAKELNAARLLRWCRRGPARSAGSGRVAERTCGEYAGLERDVVVAGVFSRIEIWNRERWHELEEVGGAALTESDDLPDFGI